MRCWRELEDSVFGICPTICCAKCCSQFRSRRGLYRGVTATTAKKKHGCSKGDLRFLNYTTALDWANRGELVYLYLEAEVDFLATLRDTYPTMCAKESVEIVKKEMEKKQQELEEASDANGECKDMVGSLLTKPKETKAAPHVYNRATPGQRVSNIFGTSTGEFDGLWIFGF